jgi:hypothetical protein
MRKRLFYDAGISGLPDQELAIKLEIDTRPPAGALFERSIITRTVTFLVQHYDPPSMMAGKLHAAITRKYVKGRDRYDLLWYRTQRPPIEPNIKLLQQALDQTHRSAKYDAHEWQSLVRNRLKSLDIKGITGDVSRFLEHPQDASLLTRENLSGLFLAQ